jgi:hypothetical protein
MAVLLFTILLLDMTTSGLAINRDKHTGERPDHRAALDAGRAFRLHTGRHLSGASERGCWPKRICIP